MMCIIHVLVLFLTLSTGFVSFRLDILANKKCAPVKVDGECASCRNVLVKLAFLLEFGFR